MRSSLKSGNTLLNKRGKTGHKTFVNFKASFPVEHNEFMSSHKPELTLAYKVTQPEENWKGDNISQRRKVTEILIGIPKIIYT